MSSGLAIALTTIAVSFVVFWIRFWHTARKLERDNANLRSRLTSLNR